MRKLWLHRYSVKGGKIIFKDIMVVISDLNNIFCRNLQNYFAHNIPEMKINFHMYYFNYCCRLVKFSPTIYFLKKKVNRNLSIDFY